MTNRSGGRAWLPIRPRRKRTATALIGGVALCVTAALTLPSAGAVTGHRPHLPHVNGVPHTDRPLASGPYRLIHKGLDNPRQLSLTHGSGLVVAEAGHGSYKKSNCVKSPEGPICIGRTGRITVLKHGHAFHVMTGLLSGASADGSFAIGSDGGAKKPGGGYFGIITFAPPDVIPAGLPGRQAGKLMARTPGGHLHIAANITRFERNHDPDGEGFDSNPYSVLALRHQTLVADAAGDYIAEVHGRKVSLWAAMPEYGPNIDPVPTVVSRGGDGKIYVGELHSEKKGKAKVYQFNRSGHILRHWNHFTTVTGVARKANGMLYVSELFGGNCGFNQIPHCFPGRVVRVAPDGSRSYFRVPFPAGIVARGNRVQVAAFSIAPSTGAFGNPAWSGQIWRIHF